MKAILILLLTIFPFVISHIHRYHDHPSHFFFPYPGFPFFPLEKCELENNYTEIFKNYEKYFEGNRRIFYFAHRNKNNEPQCYSKLKKILDEFNNNIFLDSKKFTFSCPKSSNQTEKILTLKLCFTEQEKEIIRMPDDEPYKPQKNFVEQTNNYEETSVSKRSSASERNSGSERTTDSDQASNFTERASDSDIGSSNSTELSSNFTELPESSRKQPFVTRVLDTKNILNDQTQIPIPTNQITLCFRLHGQKIEKCLYDALFNI
jgi:hypothetical protein